MKRILVFILITKAVMGFSQNESETKTKEKNHFSFKKGKSQLVR